MLLASQKDVGPSPSLRQPEPTDFLKFNSGMLHLGGGGGRDHFQEYIKGTDNLVPTSKMHICRPNVCIQFPGGHRFKKAGQVSSLVLPLATVCPAKRKPSKAASQAPPLAPDGLCVARLEGLRLQRGQRPPHAWWTGQPSIYFTLDRMVVSSRSPPAFGGTGKSSAPPGPQRHPHSSTIMSL